jgi:signal transduction histidine kinase
VGQLAENFNQMAFAVEEKVQELSDSARQKEDFVANFAHELKTPLTSIIGYADRIYQKELPREEQKQAAWYIWNEGMRLESLSKKLMDLTVLNHKDFVLQELRADLLLLELETDVAYLMAEKGVTLACTAEAANIKVEYDLFKTLFLNLVDNSIKAGADHIMVTGTIKSEELQSNYMIQVEDNGNGIPKEEIGRITEAFYMVDKSRSRKLHGAGIGLALVKKIAEIHGADLAFESDGKSETIVSISLRCEGAAYHE